MAGGILLSEFSKRLREIRRKKGFKQREMADRLGITLRAYQYYEEGKHVPDLDGLVALADVLEVSLDYLAGRVDWQEGDFR